MGQTRINQYVKRPLLRFGWLGWVAAVVLVAVFAWVTLDPDPLYTMLSAMDRAFGIEFVYWFVSLVMPFTWFAIWSPRVSIVVMAMVLLAMSIAPRPIRWWWVAGAIVLGVGSPIVCVTPGIKWVFALGLVTPNSFTRAIVVLSCASTLLAAVFVLGWTRSWIVSCLWFAAAWLAFVPEGFGGAFTIPRGTLQLPIYIEIRWLVWLAMTGGSVLGWAIVLCRRPVPSESLCPECGYELQGVTLDRCPECGMLSDHLAANSEESIASSAESASA